MKISLSADEWMCKNDSYSNESSGLNLNHRNFLRNSVWIFDANFENNYNEIVHRPVTAW